MPQRRHQSRRQLRLLQPDAGAEPHAEDRRGRRPDLSRGRRTEPGDLGGDGDLPGTVSGAPGLLRGHPAQGGQVSPLVVVRLQGLQVQEDRRAVLARGLEQRRGNQVPEPHAGGFAARLNWLRAAVLGANDGIVSTAGLVVGVAGATAARSAILTAGLAGLSAGSLAMASGEYVSVSSQRDSERALLARERRELAEAPQAELAELALLYQARGLAPGLARQVAEQLTAHDPLAAHAEAELDIDPQQLTSPWHAAGASFLSFAGGALLPLLAITIMPSAARLAVTFIVVLAALVATGAASAALGRAPRVPAIVRNVLGGALAMGVTYGIGSLAGAAGI